MNYVAHNLGLVNEFWRLGFLNLGVRLEDPHGRETGIADNLCIVELVGRAWRAARAVDRGLLCLVSW